MFLKNLSLLLLCLVPTCFLIGGDHKVYHGVMPLNYVPIIPLKTYTPVYCKEYFDLSIPQLSANSVLFSSMDRKVPYKFNWANFEVTVTSIDIKMVKQLFPQYFIVTMKTTVVDVNTGLSGEGNYQEFCGWNDNVFFRRPWIR